MLKKKKKLKIKNFIKLIIILIIIFILLFSFIKFVISKVNNNNHKNSYKKEEISEKEKKLNKLNNINKEVNFFKDEYLNRYIAYKNKNKNISDEQVIVDVNMNLDIKYYTNTKKSTFLNTNYVLVNKYNYLTEDYIPQNLESISLKYSRSGMKLVKPAKEEFEEMAEAAKKDDMTILVTSSYRSYKYQVELYNRYVSEDGKDAADTYSARPGFSEHQTALAVDIHNGKVPYTSFEQTKEFNWMQNNAYKYGFILRFPKDKERETGYSYEPWHYRYVGEKIAKYIHNNKISFEEYYVRFIDK